MPGQIIVLFLIIMVPSEIPERFRSIQNKDRTAWFFLLEKEGITLKKSNGFTLIETLLAASLLLTVAATMVPIISLVNTEREILSERRTISLKTHDELQQFLWVKDAAIPADYLKTISKKEVRFTFKYENDFVKGCAEWQNAKKDHETFCLYGIQKQ